MQNRIDLPPESLIDRGEILAEAGQERRAAQPLAHADALGRPGSQRITVGAGRRQFVDEAEATAAASAAGVQHARRRAAPASRAGTGSRQRLPDHVEGDVFTLRH